MARIEMVVGYVHNVHPGIGLKLTNRIYAEGDLPDGTVRERAYVTKVYNRRRRKTPPIGKFRRGIEVPVP